jgi:hypothetical protein
MWTAVDSRTGQLSLKVVALTTQQIAKVWPPAAMSTCLLLWQRLSWGLCALCTGHAAEGALSMRLRCSWT